MRQKELWFAAGREEKKSKRRRRRREKGAEFPMKLGEASNGQSRDCDMKRSKINKISKIRGETIEK